MLHKVRLVLHETQLVLRSVQRELYMAAAK